MAMDHLMLEGDQIHKLGEPIVRIPKLVKNNIRLQYTDAETDAIDKWIDDAKSNR